MFECNINLLSVTKVRVTQVCVCYDPGSLGRRNIKYNRDGRL